MKTKCNKCRRESEQVDDWCEMHDYKTDPKTVINLCPMCYRNFSLKAQRDALVEALEKISLGHNDPNFNHGMTTMKTWCINLVKNFNFEA